MAHPHWRHIVAGRQNIAVTNCRRQLSRRYFVSRRHFVPATFCRQCGWDLKPCPHCRRKVRLTQQSATVAENGETTAKFGDTFLRQIVALCHFSATVWTGFKKADRTAYDIRYSRRTEPPKSVASGIAMFTWSRCPWLLETRKFWRSMRI